MQCLKKIYSKIFLNRPWTLDYQKPCKEPGELCTVVFALKVTEPANECVCMWMGGDTTNPLPPNNRFRNNLCKDDS